MKKNMEHLWNAIERGKPFSAQFFHHESHMDWPGVEFRLLRWATYLLRHGTDRCTVTVI